MPKILDNMVKKVTKSGMNKGAAYAIAVSSLQKQGIFKKGTVQLTEKGKKMNGQSCQPLSCLVLGSTTKACHFS